MTETVSWVCGLWVWQLLKLSFGSLDDPIRGASLLKIPWPRRHLCFGQLLSPSAAPRYLKIFSASLHWCLFAPLASLNGDGQGGLACCSSWSHKESDTTEWLNWTELNRCPFWKRPSCWRRLKAGGEGDDRGWDGWMASLTRWIWVWVSSRSWWWTERPGVLWSMGPQRVRHDWATELNWSLNEQNSSWPYIYSLLCFSLLLIFLLDKTLRI